jgi:hypothetical protein
MTKNDLILFVILGIVFFFGLFIHEVEERNLNPIINFMASEFF